MIAWGRSFIDTFGTHYIESVTMGGKVNIFIIRELTLKIKMDSKAIAEKDGLSIQIGAAIGLSFSAASIKIGMSFTTESLSTYSEVFRLFQTYSIT